MSKTGLPKRKRDKCIIYGFTEHRALGFKLPREEFDQFGLNELYRWATWAKDGKGNGFDVQRQWALDTWLKAKGPESVSDQFDFWFEIHDRKENLELSEDGRVHIETLKHFPIPVFTNEPWPDVPAAVVFPKEAVEEACGTTYFTSTPAWMVGLAVAMGYKEIHIYGIDLAQDEEYANQRPCMEHLLGIARGKGVKVVIPPTSDLLKAVGQYGFGKVGTEFSLKVQERLAWLHSQDNEMLAKLRALDAEYNEKRAKMDEEYRQLREQFMMARAQTYGAIQDCDFWNKRWGIGNVAPLDTPFIDRSQDPATGIAAAPSGNEEIQKAA